MTTKQVIISVSIFVLQAFTLNVSFSKEHSPSPMSVQQEGQDKALLRAVVTNKLPDLQRLLDDGANPNAIAQDKNRRSALILATATGRVKMVKALLSSGADVNYKDSAGLAALNWSAMRNKTNVASQLLIWQADVNTQDNNGVTPLMYAVGTANRQLLQQLATNGADLNAVSQPTKMTPLLVAVEQGDKGSAMLLLKLGANVNASNHEGYTPLMAAAESGQHEMLKMLVTQGAKYTLKDAKGMSAMHYAQKNRHMKIDQFLQSLQNN
ncbi:ankyrin repeat domain-containing protein [Aliiglaciecola sp. LCG003]|uniref:ankyrin repeat domain-containing protein n=1 Tax=Aliiglaciecola sp. LCG003 TaxID=3053655 RepID=UPI00257423ED|nr:ankyrin repeat domain-containing protein [Aliiglaciecola sp. LCG003]WJG10681.1 ankyrin repeat domain-containing protein [Aliiglaciecola sp. LCG003]